MSTASKKVPFLTTVGSFFAPFLEAPEKTQKNIHKRSILRLWRPNDPRSGPRGYPKGGQNPSKIGTKSSLSRRGRPPATFRGVLPQNMPKIHRTISEIGRDFGRVWILALTPKLKKMAGVQPCISCFGGSVSAGRVAAS